MTEYNGTIAVVGAGSWGTALSIVLGGTGRRVVLWARRPELAAAVERERRNPDYLPEHELPPSVSATGDLKDAVEGARIVMLAVPSQGMRATCTRLADWLSPQQAVVSAAKGLERETALRMSEVVAECLGPGRADSTAVLSGPNLAPEVAAGAATATVAASRNPGLAAELQAALSTPRFRVYTNSDVVGVELGGVLKNIIAIGAGISDGLGFGENSKAALMTRGLSEMTRLGAAMGARRETFRGLSGMGDLVCTCAGRTSRNYFVGYELAKGKGLEDVLGGMTPQVAEGVETTRAVVRLAGSLGVGLPIAAAVRGVLFEEVPPLEAAESLMTRAWRDELDD